MEALSLAGRVAVVAGAAQGIGAATARRLAARGAAVALVDRNAEGVAALAGEIGAAGQTALATPADVARGEEVAALFASRGRALSGRDPLQHRRHLAPGADR